MGIKLAKKMTKIIVAVCMGCKEKIQVLCNETANIVSVRCPECFKKFNENIIEKKGEKKQKILVVDSEPHIVHLLTLTLQEIYDVTGCNSARECLRIVEKDKPDLITTAIDMAGINGYELCHALKEKTETKDIPIVIVSKRNLMNDKLHAIDVGADEFVTKPFDPKELLRLIKISLSHK